MALKRFALAWLRESDWPRWAAVDPLLQPDYNHWLNRMEQMARRLEQQGNLVEKIIVDVDEFVEWCRVNGRKVDTKSRGEFAALLSTKRHSAH